jgi:hypothetical protein
MSTTPETSAVQRPGLKQAVTGLVPPQVAEAHIRTRWRAVSGISAGASALAARLIRTVFLAPAGWMLLAPLFLLKIAPFVACRYTLTNRRLMIQRGLKPKPTHEVALADIDDVRLVESSYSAFYRAGTLEVISGGQVKLTLTAVPEPEAFRQSILNAVMAWVPGKAGKTLPMIPASAAK